MRPPYNTFAIPWITADDRDIVGYLLVLFDLIPADRNRYRDLGLELSAETDCTLAPSVADDYQSKGVGNWLMEKALTVCRSMGKKRVVLWGGVQERNGRAVNFYTKFGFERVGEFMHNGIMNYDMIRTL